MRPVNCNCDMPYAVYCDWLSDMGWDVDELRLDEDVVVLGYSSLHRYGNGNDCKWGEGWSLPYSMTSVGNGNYDGDGMGEGDLYLY